MRILYCLISFSTVAAVSCFKILSFPVKDRNLLRSRRKEAQPENDMQVDFTRIRRFNERVHRLRIQESEFLSSFWDDSLKSFKIYPKLNTSRVSVTSTCMSLDTIIANPEHWNGKAAWEDNVPSQIPIGSAIKALKETRWSFDAFQTPVLVSTLCTTLSADPKDPKFIKAVHCLLEQRSRLSLHRRQTHSAYLRYLNAKALLDLIENNPGPSLSFVPESILGTNQIGYALERSGMVAFDELCRQIAFHESGDKQQFDCIILCYSLLTYFDISKSLFLTSFARGVIPTTNMKLVAKALSIFFSSQAADGTWEKGEPIFNPGDLDSKFHSNSSSSSTSGVGRDIGNSYVFFFDILGSLLRSIGRNNPDLLVPYLENFEKAVEWAEVNVIREMLPENCDPNTNRCYGNVIQGWRSNHLGAGNAVAWCTAQVFSTLTELAHLIRTLTTEAILREFGGKPSGAANTRDWEGLMDADLMLESPTTLKNEVYDKLLLPLRVQELALKDSLLPPIATAARRVTTRQPMYSMILFGPPGTAKTTICTSIASYLGWNFVTIDTADFLADGLENIASRMTFMFDRLKALEKTIILFDEIEEFCLDRENSALSMESRMLTTAMLTQLNDLRRKQSSVFIVATNRLRSFDAAVTRPGRFDGLFFVGTPNLESRIIRLKRKLQDQSSKLSTPIQNEILVMMRAFLQKKWDIYRFMTFAENEGLLNIVLGAALQGTTITEEFLTEKTENIVRTSTIQGAVKDDYLISEGLSRI